MTPQAIEVPAGVASWSRTGAGELRAHTLRRLLYVAYTTVFCLLAIGLLGFHSMLQDRSVVSDYIYWALALGLTTGMAAWVFQLGELASKKGFIEIVYPGLKASTVGFALISLASVLAVRPLPRQVTVSFWIIAPLLTYLLRIPFQRLAEAGQRRRIVVVGNEEEVRELSVQLSSRPHDYRIVAHVNGFVGVESPSDLGDWIEVGENRLADVTIESGADLIVISPSKLNDFELLERVSKVHSDGIRIRTFTEFYEERFGKIPLNSINEAWFLFDSGELHRATYMRAKRAMDLIGGVVGTILFALAFPLVALAIKADDRGPILFRQKRVGKGGVIFDLLKFRTMRRDAEAAGPRWAVPDDDRVTRVGRFLRRSRLDELPQFINVLKGDMSLVGPRAERPEFVEQLEELIPFYSRRHLIRPGLTGWAQVSYRYGSSVEHAMEKLQYEFYYLKYQSVLLDLRIIANTARVVASMSGV